MSVITASPATLAPAADGERRHRLLLGLAILAAVALIAGLAVYGFNYYTLSQAERVFSAKHRYLKPSGTIGVRLGMLGSLLLLLVYVYPLRKRWTWLGRQGSSKHWLNFHVLLGLTAPLVISLHSSFKFHGIAGVAYWIMIAVAMSGVFGRYIYAQIPRSLNSAELLLREMEDMRTRWTEQLRTQRVINEAQLAPLFHLPDRAAVQSMPLLVALADLFWLDLTRPYHVWRIRRRAFAGRSIRAPYSEMEKIIGLASQHAAFSKRVVFLSRSQQLFHLWHVVHRPFSYSFAILASIHIIVVLLLGYF